MIAPQARLRGYLAEESLWRIDVVAQGLTQHESELPQQRLKVHGPAGKQWRSREAQQALAAISDDIIARVKAADVIVLGVPMYNFGIPSQLKALLDRIARAGITFKYTEQGAVGLLDDKPVVVFATRGGVYQGTPADSQTPFLQLFLNFVGLKDIHFVYAEGLNMGTDAQQAALAAAKERLVQISANIAA